MPKLQDLNIGQYPWEYEELLALFKDQQPCNPDDLEGKSHIVFAINQIGLPYFDDIPDPVYYILDSDDINYFLICEKYKLATSIIVETKDDRYDPVAYVSLDGHISKGVTTEFRCDTDLITILVYNRLLEDNYYQPKSNTKNAR